VDSEVEVLAEASKAYCLCQALYDDIQPMIGCDYCSDWFHWECVGLAPPREDQDHTEVAPPDFK
jgi:histone demethylase JARID1